LGGLTSNHDSCAWKSGFAEHATKHKIVLVFPDTSPRDIPNYKPVGEPHEQWVVGYGAGMYCNATVSHGARILICILTLHTNYPKLLKLTLMLQKECGQ